MDRQRYLQLVAAREATREQELQARGPRGVAHQQPAASGGDLGQCRAALAEAGAPVNLAADREARSHALLAAADLVVYPNTSTAGQLDVPLVLLDSLAARTPIRFAAS